MVSLKDISKECGVSVAAVSKALRDAPDIGAATKQHICSVAEKMGYFPNASARALKTKKTNNLGVVFKDEAGRGLTHEFFGAVLDSFKKEAETHGYDITFIHNEMKNISFLNHCRYRNFDGAAIVCAPFTNKEIVELLDSELPVVAIDYVYKGRTGVMSNNANGMEEIVSYAYQQGHKRIAYIYGEASRVSSERIKAFYDTMKNFGINVPDIYVRQGVFHDTNSSEKITGELLELPEPPTCILYPDDFSALGGIAEINRRGLRIPENISIGGFDGSSLSSVLSPKLTTVWQDTDQLGRETARRLIQLIEHPETALAEVVTIDTKLQIGESIGTYRET